MNHVFLSVISIAKDFLKYDFEKKIVLKNIHCLNYFQENGFIVAEYDTGNGKQTLRIDSKTYNDGKYHVVKFLRTGERADLIVDSLSAFNIHQCKQRV